ncbi:MAG TPA: hypothetical protein ENN92_00935 [candidate division WWE3 bacterium]|uniref:tRNA dimethylallyltransferase n=1 Tax=candidate division WWE3 bacterium TaxID=2053526 RepID=A0A7C1HMN9_UNCKA|nr:hypothetical protein [candidate division WWE3 bacterium]
MTTKELKIPVILGPTSTGKTGLALWLCKEFGGEIISADSRQIYKHMDIGTGKLPLGMASSIKRDAEFWEIEGVKIWGYDIVCPGEYYSAYDYALFALEKAKNNLSAGKTPFLVGGTGLYIDFFTHRIEGNSLPPDFNYRKKLEFQDLKDLQKTVMSLNLEVNNSDFQNKQRLVRIIERNFPREKKSGTPLPYLQNSQFIFFGLTAPRDFLYDRADLWVDSIWKDDLLLDEVKKLNSMGFENSPQLNGFIYNEAQKFIKGLTSKEEAIQRTKFNTHAYIRRQQTYFKKNTEINWFDISRDNWKQTIYNKLKDAGF